MDARPAAPVPRPTVRREGNAERAARHLREQREDARVRRRYWWGVALRCWLWAAAGLVTSGWALHTTDVDLGHILLGAGQLVTLVGVLGTLGRALLVAEERGWR